MIPCITLASRHNQEHYVDFVYIDTRHDYCEVCCSGHSLGSLLTSQSQTTLIVFFVLASDEQEPSPLVAQAEERWNSSGPRLSLRRTGNVAEQRRALVRWRDDGGNLVGHLSELGAGRLRSGRGGVLTASPSEDLPHSIAVVRSIAKLGRSYPEKCIDGSIHPGGIMGAVNHFAMQHGLQISLT